MCSASDALYVRAARIQLQLRLERAIDQRAERHQQFVAAGLEHAQVKAQVGAHPFVDVARDGHRARRAVDRVERLRRMRAASAAACSTISRISCSFSANAIGGATRAYQSSRSASSRFQTPRGRTRVPIFGRDSTAST